MLQNLSIRNVVLIDKLDLDFKSGLSVLTGETGAGKSILLDALGLVLGDRAETSLIRNGEEKLSVSAIFAPQKNNPIYAFLRENEIEVDDEIIIKRSLGRDGKGKIFINDQPVTQKLLKEMAKFLVEVHGQFDNQGLLNQLNHRGILDNYGGYDVEKTSVSFFEYKKAKHNRTEAEKNIEKAKLEEENLRHWIAELEKIRPMQGEEVDLAKRRLELMNAEKIIENLSFAHGALTQGSDIVSALRQAQSAVSKANRIVDNKYAKIEDDLESLLINSDEIISAIEDASASLSLDSNELNAIEERIFALKAIARKHQVSVDELENKLVEFKLQLSNIELGEEGLSALREAEEKTKLDYLKTAKELSSSRLKSAKNLDSAVMKELPALKMEKAKFVTQVSKTDEPCWNEHGIDDVFFSVATNPNSPQGAINKIASGGELARFMLALKVNLANSSCVETLVFDEVDTGIGGATAQAVGERLAKLAQNLQVLVVTHSPQVASKSDNHFRVEKVTKSNITTTLVNELTIEEKKEEIARMLAGEIISDEARAAAKVLIG